MFRLMKDFPLNFRMTTWRLSQWVTTITFILMFIYFKDQFFGSWKDFNFYFATPFGYISIIAIIISQLYVYGGFISNTVKDILIPMLVIGIMFIVELAFSYILVNMDYTPVWSEYFLRYFLLLVQGLLQLWVYKDVEYVIIPKEDLPELFGNSENK